MTADPRTLDAQAHARGRVALSCLGFAVAALYLWNAAQVAPLSGYDAAGHAGYILSLLREGRLPHPLAGWSTFHPPAYYLLASPLWALLEPLGASPLGAGVRGLGAAAWLGAGFVAFALIRRLGGQPVTALAGVALVWLVPCNQLSAVMLGNEAFAAALAAFALPFVLRLQRDPRDLRAACGAGLFAGLSLATKFTGFWVVVACAVPFARRDLDRRGALALGALATIGVLITAPIYLRNVALIGTPIPMTREIGPMKRAEDALVLRPRAASDYLLVDPGVFRRPSLYHLPDRPGHLGHKNPAMQRVWGLVYAGLWYDAHGHRVPTVDHRDGVVWGPMLLGLGLVPTLLLLGGLMLATRDLVGSRGRSPDAPVVVMTWIGLASFVGFTWHAPSLAAGKASYLLPLAVPGSLFFARAVERLGARFRAGALALSAVAALAAGLVFTEGLVFTRDLRDERLRLNSWLQVSRELPDAHIDEAVRLLYGLSESPGPSR